VILFVIGEEVTDKDKTSPKLKLDKKLVFVVLYHIMFSSLLEMLESLLG